MIYVGLGNKPVHWSPPDPRPTMTYYDTGPGIRKYISRSPRREGTARPPCRAAACEGGRHVCLGKAALGGSTMAFRSALESGPCEPKRGSQPRATSRHRSPLAATPSARRERRARTKRLPCHTAIQPDSIAIKNGRKKAKQTLTWIKNSLCFEDLSFVEQERGLREGEMSGAEDALIRAHRNNICRYHRLLQTSLTDLERAYIRTRLSEETFALQSLSKAESLADAAAILELNPIDDQQERCGDYR